MLSWSYAMLSQRLQAPLHAQDKIHAIQAMSFELCLHMCISSLSRQKNRKSYFLYYENRLKLKLKQQHSILLSNRSNVLSEAI